MVDGDADGQKVVELLQHDYKSWPADHFRTWAKKNFEEYYPARFERRANEVLSMNHAAKRDAKKVLLDEVKAWCESNEENAKAAFHESAKEVIDFLWEIEQRLFGIAH